MAALVVLAEMKVQLRMLSGDFDAEIDTWITTAHARIVRYIKASDEAIAEMSEIDRAALKVAEILAVKALFEGDKDAPMTGAVLTVLHDFRDPSMA